jgi:two-component system cell cycle response regulator
MKALIVDPSTTVRTILRAHLRNLGVAVVMEDSAANARPHLATEQLDFICVAMYLDDMSGTEFAAMVRNSPGHDHTPIILVTTEDNREILAEALKSGVTEIFPKEDLIKMGQYLAALVERKQVFHVQGIVLYIEQDPCAMQQTLRTLEGMGLDIRVYSDPGEALTEFPTLDADLVMANVLISGEYSGLGLIRKIRERKDELRHTPIMMLSDNEDNAKKLEALLSGASDYIQRPVMAEELTARVSNLIRNKKLFDKVREQQERLLQLAMTDQLTGLYNRHYLFETAPKRLSEALRHSIPFSLVVIDLDHFKQVNDNYGHTTGDNVLAEMAGALRRHCRKEDIVARFGGEEFIVLLSHCDLQQAADKAEDIRLALETLQPLGLTVTASLGVSAMPEGSLFEFRDLFAAADEAVYQAKHEGRNRVIIKPLI